MKERSTRREFLHKVSANSAVIGLTASHSFGFAVPLGAEKSATFQRSVTVDNPITDECTGNLYMTEGGNIVPTLSEELTTYRRVRKVLDLPSTNRPGTLFILARWYHRGSTPLRLSVNGTELPPISAGSTSDPWHWYSIEVNPSHLHPGANTFEFWTDATAMTGWSLAIEGSHKNPHSFVSDNGGITWRNQKMAYLNVLSGEYVVRMRLCDGEGPPPPGLIWEDPKNPQLRRLRAIAPPAVLAAGELMDRVRALASWISTSWVYTNSDRATVYAPWDAETILEWGKAKCGEDGQRPIVMCVHYAVCFVSFCQAVGIHGRPAVLTGDVNKPLGHFVAEVWFPKLKKWVMVDPNLDAVMCKNGVPLSIPEIRAEAPNLTSLVEWGAGTKFQHTDPTIRAFLRDLYLPGVCFRHRGIWSRADFLSHPELTPSSHGCTRYCESAIVWEKADLQSGFGMFPYFGSPDYFEAPPS